MFSTFLVSSLAFSVLGSPASLLAFCFWPEGLDAFPPTGTADCRVTPTAFTSTLPDLQQREFYSQGCGPASALFLEARSGSGSVLQSKFKSFRGSKQSHGRSQWRPLSLKMVSVGRAMDQWSQIHILWWGAGSGSALKWKDGSGTALKWKAGSGSALKLCGSAFLSMVLSMQQSSKSPSWASPYKENRREKKKCLLLHS